MMRTFLLALGASLTLGHTPLNQALAQRQPVTAIPLSDTPFLIPSLGVVVTLPEDAYARTFTAAGEKASAMVLPSDASQAWQMAIKSHKSSNTELTNTEALNSVVRQILLTRPVHSADQGAIDPNDILQRDFKYSRITVESTQKDLKINGVPAERVYLTAPTLPDYPDAGITILNPSPGEFLMIHLECPHGTLEKHKPLFELVSASVAFRDRSELNAERAGAVLATDRLFEPLNASDLETLLDDAPRFYRIYKPGENSRPIDDQDIAWQRVTISTGQAGELTPSKPRTQWSAADREYGFLLRIEARMLWVNTVVDSQGIFYLSRDRTEERWSIKNTVRANGRTQTTTQTLIRSGDKLNYVVERPSEPRYAGEFRLPERGYLSKVESTLFPRVIASRGIAGEFAYYTFDPGLDTIVLRYETYAEDGTGNWASTMKHVENALPSRLLYDDQGLIIERSTPDGQLMTPIDPERLRRLWRNKSLPID